MVNIAYLDEQTDNKPGLHKPSQKILNTVYDNKNKATWLYMSKQARPAFTPALLTEISKVIKSMQQEMHETKGEKYDFLVLASDVEGVFNYGGDLDLFTRYINNNDKAALLDYAMHCIDLVYQNHTHFGVDLTSISLVQGDALGGGFEAAVSANVVIAEKGAKMGLPETLFNMFPGMGAYSILSRKIGYNAAEEMILSGKVFTAEELYEMGLVNILAEQGEGELAVFRYMNSMRRADNTHRSMRKVRDICNPIRFEEMRDIARIWADAALSLSDRDLKMMKRLVKRQTVD